MKYLLDHWYWPLLVLLGLGGAVLYAMLGKRVDASRMLAMIPGELAAIRVKREIREVEIDQGVEAAQRAVREKYRNDLHQLDALQAKRVKELGDNPQQLAMSFERATRVRRYRR